MKPNPPTGLTAAQVSERVQKGLVNTTQSPVTKSNFAIFKDNVLTLFNLYNLLIGIALALVQAWLNLFYLLIILTNILIGIIQEARGRSLVNKLSLISAQTVSVVRDGNIQAVAVNGLVKDDVMKISAGEQICADARLLGGELEVNESLLTGESDAVFKKSGDALLSGSFVISGSGFATIEKVGADNYAAKLAAEAKKHKKLNSELLGSMRKVTGFTSFFIIPVGALLFIEAFFLRGGGFAAHLPESVVTSAAALLGMLPKGLVLLISIALAAGVINLAKKKVLVQQPYAIETLARVDLLCLDKTGTLTTGRMAVSEFHTVADGGWWMVDGNKGKNISENPNSSLRTPNLRCGSPLPMPPEQLLALFCAATDDNNATAEALKERFLESGENSALPSALSKIPFSSGRKWSSVTFKGLGTVIVGAPDRLGKVDGGWWMVNGKKEVENSGQLSNNNHQPSASPSAILHPPSSQNRLLYAAFSNEAPAKDGTLPPLTVFAAIELSDPIRKNARETLGFFKREGVDVKVISGDNPQTVSFVAREAGLDKWNDCIDMTDIDSDEKLAEAAQKYSVFGRVTPEQKKRLILAFKEQGRTVAMVGDGVNDVLALREADCGIALAAGSGAAKQISKLVLTESDFTALPDVVKEGRRVVNNITKVAGIFFVKTLYSVLLSVLFIILNLPFPFLPIQITLIDLAIEAYPSLFMSFERETQRLKRPFLNTAIMRALPFAVLILVNICVLALVGQFTDIPKGEIAAMMYLVTGFISVCAVVRACTPFNKLRAFLAATSAVGFFAAVYLFSPLLQLTLPTANLWIPAAAAAATMPILLFLTKILSPKPA